MFGRIVQMALFVLVIQGAHAQTPKGITLVEYDKAKTFMIKDLDNDTYVKFDNNTYVLDRYEGKKPYFITGDDSLKKRIDMYTLLSKADGRELGTVIYYTNEKSKLYTVCLPNVFADRAVWEKYFEDIHAIDKVEKNFVLKLSYVLSKEYSYQAYKSSLKGKEIDRAEAGTYGNDICFPGNETITLADGRQKALKEIQAGDEIVTADPVTHQQVAVKVNQLVMHDAKNYAITHLLLLRETQCETAAGYEIQLHVRELEATPNHPVMTNKGIITMGAIKEGQRLLCLNAATSQYEPFTVWQVTEKANGVQPVFNIEAAGGRTLVVNGVLVMQK
jgi:hypothetical protein